MKFALIKISFEEFSAKMKQVWDDAKVDDHLRPSLTRQLYDARTGARRLELQRKHEFKKKDWAKTDSQNFRRMNSALNKCGKTVAAAMTRFDLTFGIRDFEMMDDEDTLPTWREEARSFLSSIIAFQEEMEIIKLSVAADIDPKLLDRKQRELLRNNRWKLGNRIFNSGNLVHNLWRSMEELLSDTITHKTKQYVIIAGASNISGQSTTPGAVRIELSTRSSPTTQKSKLRKHVSPTHGSRRK